MAEAEGIRPETVLAIKRTTQGLGFVLFEGPQRPIDWGVKELRRTRKSSVEVVRELLDFCEPSVLVLEKPPASVRASSTSVRRVEKLRTLAEARRVSVYSYRRSQVRGVFEQFGVTTRHEIARKLAAWLPQFEEVVPRERKPWTSEQYRMAMFDALALVSTYYYIDG